MGFMFEKIFIPALAWTLRRRYRLKVVGIDQVKSRQGILLCANHVALIDPLLVQLATWRDFRPRPVVTKRYVDKWPLSLVFSSLGAIPAPDFFIGKNCYKLKELEETYNLILEGVDRGDNVLFYPAGRLKTDGKERIEGTSGLKTLLKRRPNLKIVMVRTTGLWGSSFSTAPFGRTPDMAKRALFALKSLFMSLFFFVPKREISIEFEEITPTSFNDWFNASYPEGEPLNFVPYFPWQKLAPLERQLSIPDPEDDSDPLIDELIDLIAKNCQVPKSQISATTYLSYDLDLDSLSLTELYTDLQSKYGMIDLWSSELATPSHIARQIRKSWHSKRHLDRMAKFERDLKGVKGVLFDPFYGWQSLSSLQKRKESYKQVFKQDARKRLPLLLPAGVDAVAAFLAAKELGKEAKLLKLDDPKERSVYTNHEMIYFGHDLVEHEELQYLPKFRGKAGRIQTGQLMIISNYREDPEAATLLAIENLLKRPVVMSCSLTANTTWSYRAAQVLNLCDTTTS